MDKLIESLANRNPSVWTVGIVLCTAIFTLFIVSMDREPGIIEGIIIMIAFGGAISFSMLSVLGHIASIKRSVRFIARLSLLYIELIILFSVAYYWMFLLSFDLPISGITPLWVWGPAGEGRSIPIETIYLTIVDLFHFSVVTMTTLGYGDMLPQTWYSKLVVDLQVLLGLGILVVGVGKYFSQGKSAQQENSADS